MRFLEQKHRLVFIVEGTHRIYAFVTQSRLLVRRLSERLPNNVVKLRADNPDYSAEEFALDQALEIWEVKAVSTSHLRPPSTMEELLARLG